MAFTHLLLIKSSFRKDLFITFLSGVGLVFGVVVLYGAIARLMGLDALGEFLIVRRTTLELIGVLVIGLNIGLPYYISRGRDATYGTAALLLAVIITIPLIGIASGALYMGAIRGFPNDLALPFFIFTLGYAMQLLAFSLLRGFLNMLAANLLQLIGTGIIPIIIVILLYERDIAQILLVTGIGTLLFSTIVYLARIAHETISLQLEVQKIRHLLAYGIQRVPGFIAQFILIAGVPLLILNTTSKAGVAFVNAGISVLRLFMLIAGPLGTILLPRLSRALDKSQNAKVTHSLDALGKTVLLIGIPTALFLHLNSRTILTLWLGGGGAAGAGIVGIIVLALPFYLLMVIYRSPIDAAGSRGYNSVNYGVAATALLLTFYILRILGIEAITAGIISFIVGQITTAIGCYFFIHKLYNINLISRHYVMILSAFIMFSSILFFSFDALLPELVSFTAGGICLLAALGLFFMKSRADWVTGLRSFILLR